MKTPSLDWSKKIDAETRSFAPIFFRVQQARVTSE